MAQDSKESSGFTLPQPADTGASSANAVASVAPASNTTSESPVWAAGSADTSSRDLLVGGGILIVLFIAFFFAKSSYANTLVSKRVPPNKANSAGWWLFIFLASLATGVVLAAVNASKFMAPLIIGPIALMGMVALILTFVSGRK